MIDPKALSSTPIIPDNPKDWIKKIKKYTDIVKKCKELEECKDWNKYEQCCRKVAKLKMRNSISHLLTLDNLRIIFFIPIAWLAYNISANLIADFSSMEFITNIGPNVWRYGFDIIQFLVFIISGIIIVPKKVRMVACVILIINYAIAFFVSIWISPLILLTLPINSRNVLLNKILGYIFLSVPIFISIPFVAHYNRRL